MARLIEIRLEIKLFLTLLFILTSTACTRAVDDLSVNITLPVNSKSNSTLDANGQLEEIIVNLHHVPGKPDPWIHVFRFDQQNRFGGVVEIPGVPAVAGIVIQVVGLYKMNETGGTRIGYGGVKADLKQGYEVTVTLKTQNNSSRMGEVAGRYLNTEAPHPSGSLVALYQPRKEFPPMEIWKGEITDGWFRAVALEETETAANDGTSAGFTYVVKKSDGTTSAPLFQRLRFKTIGSTPGFQLVQEDNEGVISPIDFDGTYRALFHVPKRYHSDHDGTMEAESAELLAVGFFGTPVNSAHQVCYPSLNEGLARVKVLNGGSYEPLNVDLTSSTVRDDAVTVLDGGRVSASLASHYNFSDCDPFNPDHLLIRHQYLGRDTDEALGMRVPFQEIGYLSSSPKFITGDFGHTVADKVTLKWQSLPGVSAVQGYEIFYKPHNTGSTGGTSDGNRTEDDVDRCEHLKDMGFRPLADVAGLANVQYSFDGFTVDTWNRNEYAVCAYGMTAEGEKRYIGNYVRSSCLDSGCEDAYHTGWAVGGNQSISGTMNMLALGGGTTRVPSVTSEADHRIKVGVADSSFFMARTEVLIMVQSASASCGTYNGRNIGPGQFHFAPVIEATTGYIWIPKGSWVDHLDPAVLAATPAAGQPHCFVQAMRVPHFRDVTFSSGSLLLTTPLDMVAGSGGVVAFRVNGKLDMSNGGQIDVSSMGFRGGTGSNIHGASPSGDISVTLQSGAQGRDDAAGGGGGGAFGQGGSNSLPSPYEALGGQGLQHQAPLSFRLGGGGGAGFDSVLSPGGTGGGAIFIVAQNFIGPTEEAALFMADGEDKNITGNTGGGGGGGSVNLYFKKTSGQMDLYARGGGGGTGQGDETTVPGVAGNGGGGFMTAVLCDLNKGGVAESAIGWNTDPGINSNTSGEPAQPGSQKSGSLYGGNDSQWRWFCHN